MTRKQSTIEIVPISKKKEENFTNLLGATVLRSVPMVSMTLLPHIHRPIDIPTPPKNKIQMGVAASPAISPVVAVSQILTTGPMALLQTNKECFYWSSNHRLTTFYDFQVLLKFDICRFFGNVKPNL